MLALLDLPDELLLLIALQCDDVADVSRFARTCTALHTLITQTDHFWSLMLARHFNVHSHSDGARAHEHARACTRAHARAPAGASSSAAVDHRALFREQCTHMQWSIAAHARAALQLGDEPGVVRYVGATQPAVPSAYTARPLPARGLSAFGVMLSMPLSTSYHIGLVALDAEDGAEWTQQDPPAGRLRACVRDACEGEVVHPNRGETHVRPVRGRWPVFMPAGWSCGGVSAAGTAYSCSSEQCVTMAVDADRGRVYYALGDTGVFLIAFDDEQLAHVRNLRVYVTLPDQGASARIERVRVTDALRAALHAVDAEYAAAQRAGM